jgi:hypothetical protein
MSHFNELKWEVFKTYSERLRYLALYEEYLILFQGMLDRNYFIKMNNKTPEQSYLEIYEYWKSVPNNDVWTTLSTTWDEDYIKDTMFDDSRSTNIVVEDVENFVQSIKK